MKQLSGYTYETIADMSYTDWAQAAYEQYRTPLLLQSTADRLEEIFGHEGCFSQAEYAENLEWLEDLEMTLHYAWNIYQRDTSGLNHVVKDYKAKFAV